MVKIDGADTPARLVYKVTERTILSNGQLLLIPEIEVETYWTTLPDPVEDIICPLPRPRHQRAIPQRN